MNYFLKIEESYREDLSFIPYAVRYKLDKLAVKISLKTWQSFSLADRKKLFALPFEDEGQELFFFNELKKIVQKNFLPKSEEKLIKKPLEEGNAFQQGLKSHETLAALPEELKNIITEKGYFMDDEKWSSKWSSLGLLEKYAIKKWVAQGKWAKLNHFLNEN